MPEVPPVVVAGNSFGGQLAWELAVARPARVSRLILVDAAGYPRQSSSVPIGFRLAQVPALAPLMARLLPRRMIESSVQNVYGDPTRVTDELVDERIALLRERFATDRVFFWMVPAIASGRLA
mgnify:CR=1 FL=1